MNNLVKKNDFGKITIALIFTGLILFFAIASAKEIFIVTEWNLTHMEVEEDIFAQIDSSIIIVEDGITHNVYERFFWIENYGYLTRLMGKKELSGVDYALDKTGSYEPVNYWSAARDTNFRPYAQRLSMLRDNVEAYGGHFLFVMYPHKMNEAWNEGYYGVPYNDFNYQADVFLAWLNFYGVDYIDLRDTLKESGHTYEEMFYKTDHHWTGEIAFEGFVEIIDYLNEEYDAGLDPDYYYRDKDNYIFSYADNTFLGSYGRTVGIKFGDLEPEAFQTVEPKFSVNYEWYTDSSDVVSNELLNKDALYYSNIYKSDMYRYYMGGINNRDVIHNLDNTDAPSLAFIRDSFSSPIIIDMVPLFSEINATWGKMTSDRYVKDELLPAQNDYVIVGYYPENIESEFFKFYADDVEEFKLEYAIEQGYTPEEE